MTYDDFQKNVQHDHDDGCYIDEIIVCNDVGNDEEYRNRSSYLKLMGCISQVEYSLFIQVVKQAKMYYSPLILQSNMITVRGFMKSCKFKVPARLEIRGLCLERRVMSSRLE